MHELVNPMIVIALEYIYHRKDYFPLKIKNLNTIEHTYTIQKHIVHILFENILHTLILLNEVGRVYMKFICSFQFVQTNIEIYRKLNQKKYATPSNKLWRNFVNISLMISCFLLNLTRHIQPHGPIVCNTTYACKLIFSYICASECFFNVTLEGVTSWAKTSTPHCQIIDTLIWNSE